MGLGFRFWLLGLNVWGLKLSGLGGGVSQSHH